MILTLDKASTNVYWLNLEQWFIQKMKDQTMMETLEEARKKVEQETGGFRQCFLFKPYFIAMGILRTIDRFKADLHELDPEVEQFIRVVLHIYHEARTIDDGIEQIVQLFHNSEQHADKERWTKIKRYLDLFSFVQDCKYYDQTRNHYLR